MLPSSGGVPLFFWRTGGARNFGASAQERSGTEIAKDVNHNALWRDNLGENGAAIRMRSGSRTRI
jgi:hypothetical protein